MNGYSEILPAEYDLYTSLCQGRDLFLFDRPDTIFNDFTGDNFLQKINPDRPRFNGRLKYKFLKHKDAIEDYDRKNAHEWRLEKRFDVENGYRFRSELSGQDSQITRSIFTLSRVGFSRSGNDGIVHIAYSNCGYYLLFHHTVEGWQQQAYLMSYSYSTQDF